MVAPGHLLSQNKINLCENTKVAGVWPIDTGWGPGQGVNRYILSGFTGFTITNVTRTTGSVQAASMSGKGAQGHFAHLPSTHFIK